MLKQLLSKLKQNNKNNNSQFFGAKRIRIYRSRLSDAECERLKTRAKELDDCTNYKMSGCYKVGEQKMKEDGYQLIQNPEMFANL